MRLADRSLDEGRASVWLVDAASQVPVTLTSDEHARMDRYQTACLRGRFARARSALRLLLSRRLNIPALDLPLMLSPAGKPMMDWTRIPNHPPVSVSVSHCGEDSIIALAAAPEVGVDMACCEAPIDTDLVARWLDARSARTLAAMALPQRRTAFLAWWTALEAVGKADGGGLPVILPEASLLFHPDPSRRRTVRALGRTWTLTRLRVERRPDHREVTIAMQDLETGTPSRSHKTHSRVRLLA